MKTKDGKRGEEVKERATGPRQVEAVSILHSIIPVHIFTLSNAFTCAQVFPPGARLQFGG